MLDLKQKALSTLGSVIRKKRLEMGITQEALGEKVGYGKLTSKQVISQIERGATAIPNKKMNDFIAALNLERETFQQVNFLIATQEYQKALELMKPFLEGSILMGNSLSSPKNESSDTPPSDNQNEEEKPLTKESEIGDATASNIESLAHNAEGGRVTDFVMETEDDDEQEKLGSGRNETPKQKHNANMGKNQNAQQKGKEGDKLDEMMKKLVDLQTLLDNNLITKQDYEDTKKRLLSVYF